MNSLSNFLGSFNFFPFGISMQNKTWDIEEEFYFIKIYTLNYYSAHSEKIHFIHDILAILFEVNKFSFNAIQSKKNWWPRHDLKSFGALSLLAPWS